MERLTEKSANGWRLIGGADEAVAKLGAYEEMQQALLAEREAVITRLERLRAEGKTKSVTFQQLLSEKLMLTNLAERFGLWGL